MMASSREFVEYAAEQLSGAGEIRYRDMFGEYGLYLDGKFFAMVCDNQLLFKDTGAGRRVAPDLSLAEPYPGAKPCILVENLDDREGLIRLARATCDALPLPKPRRRRGEKG